jgi:hypothetical protein
VACAGSSVPCVTMKGGGVGVTRTAWLTGGSGRDGGLIVSDWVHREAAQ